MRRRCERDEEGEEKEEKGGSKEEESTRGPFSTPVSAGASDDDASASEEALPLGGRSQIKTRPPLSWFSVELPVS